MNREFEQPQSLGTQLDWIDAELGKLESGLKIEALFLLKQIDLASGRVNSVSVDKNVPSAELSQYEYLIRRIKKDANLIIKVAGGSKKYKQLRHDTQPDQTRWWWYLDDLLKNSSPKKIRRNIQVALIILVTIAVLAGLYEKFLAPDSQTRQGLRYQSEAENDLIAGDYPNALLQINRALTFLPENPDSLVMKAVLLEKLGQEDEAKGVTEQVNKIINDPEQVDLLFAQMYMNANDPQNSRVVAERVLEINPDSAQAYYFIGLSYELQGDIVAAVKAYNQAVQLASNQGNSQLEATIRVKLGLISQQLLLPTAE